MAVSKKILHRFLFIKTTGRLSINSLAYFTKETHCIVFLGLLWIVSFQLVPLTLETLIYAQQPNPKHYDSQKHKTITSTHTRARGGGGAFKVFAGSQQIKININRIQMAVSLPNFL